MLISSRSAMGCLHSKKEVSELHPNVFRVVNIDENGLDLCSGQLEITDTDIILYREGRDSTVWPLHSLRRYGFEGEIFSFESGRRCETGEGIYGFKCRRASLLFRTLQQHIQLRNVIHDSVPYPVTRLAGSPAPARQTLQASVVHRSSIDNSIDNTHVPPAVAPTIPTVVPRNVTQSPRSPSSVDILEVMPLYPRTQASTTHVTNVYQVRDFKREHNNNQAEATAEVRHVYSNDLNRDLAILRNTLRQETVINTMRDIEDETRFLESRYLNDHNPEAEQVTPLSPTFSSSSEHYAQLSIEQQESARLYMNLVPCDVPDANKNEGPPSTPVTPKQAEYCIFLPVNKSEANTYANLALGDKNSKMLRFNAPTTEHSQKFSESDTFPSLSPVEELEVNYAVLDIDGNKEVRPREFASPESQSYNSSRNESSASCASQGRGRLVSQGSVERGAAPAPSVGYTTIDFDKTVALTSVAAGDVDDGQRKRHDSTSPSGTDKPKLSFG
ncbi:uncharacterized protein LOC133515421 [Cydia pomonella]|uniref:uncharacterized protein LOC133515421 n=1 Tax=Cydia pomonella TaxID=82600 RepID=UPI002ADE808E|nr:uncharacterized protein LOC133515421 [Cydia pomonella]